MTLRGRPVEESTTLPDGRSALVRVGVADDPYVARSDMGTVALELVVDGEVEAALNTVLDVDQESEALALALDVARGLAAGDIQPTAGALEPFADALR